MIEEALAQAPILANGQLVNDDLELVEQWLVNAQQLGYVAKY